MNTYQDFWNGEKNLPNLLNMTDIQELSAIVYKQAKIVEEKLIIEAQCKITFNLEYIKRIHALIFCNLYEHAGTFRTIQITNKNIDHPATYLVSSIMNLYEEITLKKYKKYYSSTQELVEYIYQVYSDLLFINPFLTGNVLVASVLVNLMLCKMHLKKIDFTKINQIPYDKYVSALYESISYNYIPMANIIKVIM